MPLLRFPAANDLRAGACRERVAGGHDGTDGLPHACRVFTLFEKCSDAAAPDAGPRARPVARVGAHPPILRVSKRRETL